VPIEMVQLAPELDPDSGRGSRHGSKKEDGLSKDKVGGAAGAEADASDSEKSSSLADMVISPSATDSSGVA